MKDKKLEADIKKTKDFVELWSKFHQIFENVFVGNATDKEEEKHFFSTKTLVNSRYDDLMDSFGVKPIRRFIKGESIYGILSLESLSTMADEKYKMVERNWEDSFKLLNSLLERLERKKRRIERFNRFFFVLKKGINKMR